MHESSRSCWTPACSPTASSCTSRISATSWDQLGIEAWTETGVAGAGSGSAARAVQAGPVSFTAGDAVFTNQRLVVLQNDSFAKFPRDGVIGHSLLGHHAVEIDHDAMMITLHDPGSLRPGSDWCRIPLAFKSNKIPWPWTCRYRSTSIWEVRSKQTGAEAVLGNGALRRFNQIYDYSAGVLYLKPSESFEERFD